ncbi:MAG: Arsenite methyltransferase [Phycisphaerae bacterium]|nr:Arsenite methyltransferase [Phycisphaerae bacterium]
MPTEIHRLIRFYRWNAPIYDLTRWTILRYRQAAINALQLQPGEAVLEIGCGTGWNLLRMATQVGIGGRVIGIDVSQDMLRVAQRRAIRYIIVPHINSARAKARGSLNTHSVALNPFHLLRASAEQLALNTTFDALLFSYSLTMIPQWQRALRNAWAMLKPAGRLVIVDFGYSAQPGLWRSIWQRYLQWNHVDLQRDFLAELQALPALVESIRPPTNYYQLFRARKQKLRQ